ncbi:MAG: S9 family peptidase [Phototrophicales bacterium]
MNVEKRPIQVDDLYKIVKIEDPQVSPDGQWVAFVKVTLDKLENNYKRHIWLAAVDGSQVYQLTRGGKDTTPRWSPDGNTLAFVSARGDKPQIYLLAMSALGGEARQLTNLPNGAVMPEWSPDGKQIAFLSPSLPQERIKEDSKDQDAPPVDQLEAKHRKERTEHDEKKRLDPYVMTRIPYREGTAFRDGRFSQVYVITTEEGDDIKPRRLTDFDVDHSPVKWAIDGQALYLSHAQSDVDDEPFNQMSIYRLDLETETEMRMTDDSESAFAPLPSPDGQWIAYLHYPRRKYHVDTQAILRLTIRPADGGEARTLNLDFDRSIDDFAWLPDSSGLIFAAPSMGDGWLFQVKLESGEVTPLAAAGTFRTAALSVSKTGGVAFVASIPTNPGELFWLAPGKDIHQALTDFNAQWLKDVIVQQTHEMWFDSPSGKKIQGWYILPVGYEEGKQYPLALNIHGGPRAMWGPSESTMFHEWQFHAASGYVVFYCNPRGAEGYGEQFMRDLHRAWGDVAMDDIMAGVDTLLEKGFVDSDRMAITGGSYGGYMTAWIVGHTDRFRCAVTQRGVYNLTSFYGTSDVPSLITSDFDVEPWEDVTLLWQHSPLAYAHNINTPLLIIHAENDYRVPIEQAEQLFAFVRRATDTPVEMVRYPRDGHELSRSGEPEHRVSRLTHMVEWFDRYCK